MSFTNILFLIGLLPWFIILTYILRNVKKAKIILLLIGNMVFYLWGGTGAFLFLSIYSILAWLFCIIAAKVKNRIVFGMMLLVVMLPLLFVKYAGLLAVGINSLCGTDIGSPNAVIPIGISFFTFEAISLLADIYRGTVKKVSFIQVFSYLTFFPTVASGPIMRFQNFKQGLYAPAKCSDYNAAVERIVVGLCKKVLIADKISLIADYYFEGVANGNSYSTAGLWIGSFAYTLQLYFDFSGYSDMAIGIGRLIGFDIGENFDRPYQAGSISDFWKRWHISLSRWFKDYVYIPLGGSRCSVPRHIFNMLAVWCLTGIWHGADWSFLIWGLGYFILLVMEKYLPFIKKIQNSVMGHLYTLFFVNLLWVPFRAKDLGTAGRYIGGMFGIGSSGGVEALSLKFMPYLMFSALLCLPFGKVLDKLRQKGWYGIARGTLILALAGLAVSSAVNASYTPYIYGNF